MLQQLECSVDLFFISKPQSITPGLILAIVTLHFAQTSEAHS